ncbi:hypothetical protein PCANC_28171 [Puccinia coronata f. sp. avenae]|uniref:Uncharacterized protein n=1 Tax=Puccinia coronata f. sp. avenae TaxID=200324 RepID=A0A2N5RX44_9BASI|nr:hypothetical protein PCANC_28171 [Puccinia coronata f. sp. avenae]
MPRQVLRGAVQAPVSIDQAEYVQLAGAYRFAKMRALVVLPAGQSPSLVHLAFENSLYRTYSPLHGNQPRSEHYPTSESPDSPKLQLTDRTGRMRANRNPEL